MSLDLPDYKSTLVHVMAWCNQAASHYLSQCWHRSILHHMASLGHNELKGTSCTLIVNGCRNMCLLPQLWYMDMNDGCCGGMTTQGFVGVGVNHSQTTSLAKDHHCPVWATGHAVDIVMLLQWKNKANLRDLIAATSLVIWLKLD